MSELNDQLPPGSPVPPAAPAAGPTEQQIELQKLAAFAFGDPMPPAVDPASPAAIINTPDTPPATPPIEETILDSDAFIKENFGLDTLDAFKSEWQQLQELKKNPPKAAEAVYTSDQAKKIASAINAGDPVSLKTVRDYLDAQLSVNGVETMTEEQKLKLFIRLQNPLYDQELVDYQYSKDFIFDDAAFKDENGNIKDQMAYRFAKTQAMQKAQTELNRANEFFGTYKSKIQLPAVGLPQNTPDADYEDFKASTAQSSEFYTKSIVPAINALRETDVPLSFKVSDPSNQMDFDVPLIIEKGDFDTAKKNALDYPAYLSETFYDKDGNFLAQKMARAIALEKNFDKYAQSIARQAVNAERQRVINKESANAGNKRDYNTVEMPSELKELEKMVFPGN